MLYPFFRAATVLLPPLFVLLLCTCGPAPEQAAAAYDGPTKLAGTLRYQQDQRLLEATLRVDPAVPDGPAPLLLGSALEPLATAGTGRFRTRRSSALPTRLSAGMPCTDREACTTHWNFVPPFADSLPAVLSKSRNQQIPVLEKGLTAEESLVVFFEPRIRKTPHRLQLIGPTATGFVTLRREALADIPAGDYRIYLVKQQLHRDSTDRLVSTVQTEYFTRSREVTVTE